MKNTVLKYYIATFYLCSTFALFAAPGVGNGGTGEEALEAADAPAAPIDNYIWVLALVGFLFVFMRLRAIQNKKVLN
jgi:hypothetical protein